MGSYLLEHASIEGVALLEIEADLRVRRHDEPLDQVLERVGLDHRPRKVRGITQQAKKAATL